MIHYYSFVSLFIVRQKPSVAGLAEEVLANSLTNGEAELDALMQEVSG